MIEQDQHNIIEALLHSNVQDCVPVLWHIPHAARSVIRSVLLVSGGQEVYKNKLVHE